MGLEPAADARRLVEVRLGRLSRRAKRTIRNLVGNPVVHARSLEPAPLGFERVNRGNIGNLTGHPRQQVTLEESRARAERTHVETRQGDALTGDQRAGTLLHSVAEITRQGAKTLPRRVGVERNGRKLTARAGRQQDAGGRGHGRCPGRDPPRGALQCRLRIHLPS